MILYHGTRKETLSLHLGLCLTPCDRAAEHYATARGEVHELDVDFSGLRVVKVATGDRDAQDYAGDSDLATIAETADVIRYDDEDTHGHQHETYRIITQAALDRVNAACSA